jgi:signal transduction histidine kinase
MKERVRREAARARDPDAIRRIVDWLQILVAVPVVAWLVWGVFQAPAGELRWTALFFMACIAVVELIPIPAWQTVELSLSFPIMVAVAMLYNPPVAGAIAWLGACDLREFRREIPLMRGVWNRSQMALSVVAGSWVFHLFATADDPWFRLVSGALAAALVAYAINTLLVALHAALEHDLAVSQVLVKMHGARPLEFLISYLGLALLGAVIARFFLAEGAWSVVVFLAPLVFSRQMYFQSRLLADRLADQNELLAEQASRLEELLRKEHQTVDELRELNRMKGDFVAVVSHELRTPVTALIGYAKTLRQPEFSNDPTMREEFLERMERQGDRLLRLVENLLTTARLESHELQITVGRLLFEDLVREVVEGLGSEATRVKLEVPEDLPVIHTDRQLMGRVLSNLLDNALKYSPDGSPCELGARTEPDHVAVWVTDHGIGIEPAKIDRIFDRFYQVDSSSTRRFPGAGLGLSMVHDLLDRLGGTISVVSRLNEGSTFTIRLPVSVALPESTSERGGAATG